ncbi:hypothetical protein [Chloroflexus sp.]|uniref:hypothetical protein n=1 Tax=Chloroflexus sp. TaxID=1904827 RepID=UPI00404A0098
MIAIGAGLSDWPGGSAPLQPCQHVLGGLLYPLVMHVSCGGGVRHAYEERARQPIQRVLAL